MICSAADPSPAHGTEDGCTDTQRSNSISDRRHRRCGHQREINATPVPGTVLSETLSDDASRKPDMTVDGVAGEALPLGIQSRPRILFIPSVGSRDVLILLLLGTSSRSPARSTGYRASGCGLLPTEYGAPPAGWPILRMGRCPIIPGCRREDPRFPTCKALEPWLASCSSPPGHVLVLHRTSLPCFGSWRESEAGDEEGLLVR